MHDIIKYKEQGVFMAIGLFNEENWDRLEDNYFSRVDFRNLDMVKDSILFSYMLVHAKEKISSSVMQQHGLKQIPELPVKIRTAYDELYLLYLLLQEQVRREDSIHVLKEAAYNAPYEDMRRFAFCRLTGYAYPSGWTYSCGLKEGMNRERIEEFCREMISRDGPLKLEAEERLEELKDVSDETLAVLSSLHTERGWDDTAEERLKKALRPAKGTDLQDDLEDKVRLLFDAYIYEVCDTAYGRYPGAVFKEAPHLFTESLMRWVRKHAKNEKYSSMIMKGLAAGDRMTSDLTEEDMETIVWAASKRSPQHSYFLWMAYWYAIGTAEDNVLALQMLEDSAAGGFVPAYTEMVRINDAGDRIRRNAKKALMLQEEKTELCRKRNEERSTYLTVLLYRKSLKELGDLYMKAGRPAIAKKYHRAAAEL